MEDLGDAGAKWTTSDPVGLNVVFVHGFKGDHLATWTYKKKAKGVRRLITKPELVTIFDLLRQDSCLKFNYFSFAHKASIRSTTDLERAGSSLRSFLRNYVMLDNDVPIALIAHSFGGLACRFAILAMLDDLEDKIPVVGLLMMGTPNNGTEIARAAKALGSPSARDMRPFDKTLAKLNRDWTAHIVNGGDPSKDPSQRAPLVCWAAIGTEDRVVPASSASALASFSNVEYLNKGHIALVKSRDKNDSTYVLIKRFLSETEEFATRRDGEWAVKHLTYRLRKASLEGHWVREEQMHIKLESTSKPNYLKCNIRNIRKGGLAQSTFNVCVWLSGYRPRAQIDFDWEIGKGVLSQADYDRFVGGAMTDFDAYFRIETLNIRQGNEDQKLVIDEAEKGQGWYLFKYKMPEHIKESKPYDELTLETSSYVEKRQGWLFYVLPRTVTEHLEVTFQAPFKYGAICRLGKGSKVTDLTQVGGNYISRATVDGQVSLGRNIVWVYEA